MYELKIITHFSAAHQLKEFHGDCENLHGHNWKIEVYVTGEDLDDDGLLIDFKVIKKATQKALNELDHQYLNDLAPFRAENPSSENIARYIFESLGRAINSANVKVSKVSAWESDTACATYMGP